MSSVDIPDFKELLMEFIYKIRAKYGHNSEVVKIGVSKELYQIILHEVNSSGRPLTTFMLSEFKLMGVSIVPREKDTF